MRQTVRVIITDEEGNKDAAEFKVEELKFKPKKQKKFDKKDVNDKELEELEALERKESGSSFD